MTPKRVAILEGDDLASLLDHASRHSIVFELLALTGLRIGEALGLIWAQPLTTGDLSWPLPPQHRPSSPANSDTSPSCVYAAHLYARGSTGNELTRP